MWKTVKLGDVCELAYGKALDKKDILEIGGYPAFGANGIKTQSKVPLYDKPSIIIGRKGSAGEINKVTEPFWALDVTYYTKIDEQVITLDYLFYVLTTLNLPSLARGVKPGINRNDVYEQTIPLPPLAEQQRIVAKLDAAFAEIDRAVLLAEQSKENSLRFYSHTIDALFEDYSSDAVILGNLSTINYGYTAKASYEKGSYKFLRITDIQENNVNWESVPFCDVEEKKLAKFLLHDGDIVFARTGATTGKSFLVEKPNDAVFASYLIRVSVDREKLIPRYVMHYFQSASYWKQVEEGISGAAQGGFNATKLSELKIPAVAKDIQQALITRLDDALETSKQLCVIYTEKTQQLSQLKSALLAQELQPPQSEAA